MAKALADRLAEAFAECLHQTGPRRLGLRRATSNSTSDDLIDEKYRGIRPAPGYPACPDHTEKRDPVRAARRRARDRHPADRKLRHAPGRQRQRLVLRPSRKSLLLRRSHHPRPGRDYARRKGMTVAEVERWLSPNLGYEPRG